jgi:hypothetical protein
MGAVLGKDFSVFKKPFFLGKGFFCGVVGKAVFLVMEVYKVFFYALPYPFNLLDSEAR